MLIVSDDLKFGVLWEVYEQSDDKSWTFGMVRLIIDGEIFPKKTRFNDIINVIFHNMKCLFLIRITQLAIQALSLVIAL